VNKFAALVAIVGIWSVLSAQTTEPERIVTRYELPSTERERVVDFERIRIAVQFDPAQKRVIGQVTHVFVPIRTKVDSIVLDGIRMTVTSARSGSAALRVRTTDSTVIVYGSWHYPRRDSITIDYECSPRRGLYFPGWDDPTNRKRKQIWTQGQPFDTRHWVPIYDYPNDKAITEMIVTFDSSFAVLSNGRLISKRNNKDGTITWHYTMTKPHATYLIMLAIGKYGILERRTKRGLPLRLYYYADHPEWAEPTYRYSAEMVDFLEELLTVPFPWESYSQVPVQDYIAGAMENTTATVFGDFFHGDSRAMLDRPYVSVNMHELTHQWFGDYITQRDERSIWLHESFATFYPKLFFRRYFGEDYHQWIRRAEQNAALSAASSNTLPILHRNAGTARIYSKGSAVLDMLMDVVGEEQFHRAIAHYLRKHAYGTVETRDFENAFADALGMNLGWFFDQWLYRGGEPHYRVSTAAVQDRQSGQEWVEFTIEQTQSTDGMQPLFRMPIVLEVHYRDSSSQRVRAPIADRVTRVRVPNPNKQEIAFALFDPGSVVLKRVDFPKTTAELIAQARLAPLMIDRYDALESIANDSTLSDSIKVQVFAERFAAEQFYAPRVLIARTLARNETLHRFPDARATLIAALGDRDVEVRRAAISSLGRVPDWLRSRVESLLSDSSYAVIAAALERLSSAFPENALSYVQRVQGIDGANARVRITADRIRAERGDSSALAELIDFASPSYEFTTRQLAMDALRTLNWCDSTLVGYLLEARFHFNQRLAWVARETIRHFAQQSGYRRLFRQQIQRLSDQWQRDQLEELVP
jgi:aminopeptidase N